MPVGTTEFSPSILEDHMTEYVTSADGTRIAFERMGGGSPVIVVGGMFSDRAVFRPLAAALSGQFEAVTFDRRGRGDSGDSAPYAVGREVEDIAAVIAALGGSAAVYGHSSGAALVLNAAAGGLPITRLVLHEPPYGGDDEESMKDARALAETVRAAIADGRRPDAINAFLAAMGLPPEMAEPMSADPRMLALAPTMPYDLEVVGDFTGGAIPTELVRRVTMPTLVIAGTASLEWFRDTASRIVELLPDGRLATIEGHGHDAPAEAVAPVVAEFLS